MQEGLVTTEVMLRDLAVRQRLLEGWLPLAQDANETYAWALDATGLEALIVCAAPTLRQAQTALTARAILWSTHQRLYTKPDR
jgi:hypothetical protein